MPAPRPYIHHTTRTITYLRTHYPCETMAEIAQALGIPAGKLYFLAQREGIQKRKQKT